jgi:signal peptidase
VILPVVIILAFEGFILGRNILQVNRAKMEEKYAHEKEDQKALLESEKEKIRQEILAELNNNKNTDEKSE